MTLKQFLTSCNTNLAEIYVYNKNDTLVYTGSIYLIFTGKPDSVGREMTNEQRDALLSSKVEAWELTNTTGLINVYTDYE